MAVAKLDNILFAFCVVLLNSCVTVASRDKLLLFLIDGFRWDYFDHFNISQDLPAFDQIFREGVKAEYLVPTYPADSYPNYYSLMTGRYPENHGFVGNYMYDVEHNETFLIGTNKEQYHAYWWEDAEPLWITAEKQDLRTAWYYWLGTEVTIFGRNSTHVTPYTQIPTMGDLEQAIRSAIQDIVSETSSVVGYDPSLERAESLVPVRGHKLCCASKNGRYTYEKRLNGDFGVLHWMVLTIALGIYVEEIDHNGHTYGPASNEVLESIRELDRKLMILLRELEDKNLANRVNIMIYSDHGMASRSLDKIVNLTQAIDLNDIFVHFIGGSYAQIWPNEDRTDQVMSALQDVHPNVTVYRKQDLPERYHLKNHRRAAPIILVADLPWSMLLGERSPNETWDLGGHGFDNDNKEMRGIFAAMGPGFRKNYITKGFDNVHIYSLMCHLLQITPGTNDGNWNSVSDMLLDSPSSVATVSPTKTMVFLCALNVLLILHNWFLC